MLDDKELYAYCHEKSSKGDSLLERLYRDTHLKTLAPRMVSGSYQGRLLSMISKLLSPHVIVEIGTFTGYSALCLAEGLREDGKLYTIDIDPEYSYISTPYFEKSQYAEQIQPIVGDAKEELQNLDISHIDLVFMDAKKRDYPVYYELVLPKLRSGGLILADNILWSGKVLQDKADKTTEAIKAFNEMVKKDERVENIILPIRDGINVIRKK